MSFSKEGLQQWFEEYRETFDQTMTEEDAQHWVGRVVDAHKEAVEGEGVKSFRGRVVGYSHTVLGVDDDLAHQWALLTDEGFSFAIFAGMELREVSEEPSAP